ncbi:MAG: hypothetical protein JST79_21885 [Acidobacteria bacterium]|nr:hypothetical protein [Acidobacteriota bacterium]
MFGHKVKIEGDLLEKAKQCAEASGYASVDEFVVHTLEKEIARLMGPGDGSADAEAVKKRLQGLGYLE